jgi:hypothetical protein
MVFVASGEWSILELDKNSALIRSVESVTISLHLRVCRETCLLLWRIAQRLECLIVHRIQARASRSRHLLQAVNPSKHPDQFPTPKSFPQPFQKLAVLLFIYAELPIFLVCDLALT